MSTQPESWASSDSHTLSPQELTYEIDSSLRLQQEKRRLRVAGVFRDLKKDKIYGGCFYDAVLDPVTRHSLTLLVPVDLKRRLRDGRAYEFRGFLRRKVSGGRLGIEVEFRVTGVENVDLPAYDETLVRRSDAFHAKCSRGFKRVERVILERLREGGLVRVALVHGLDAVVDRDVLDGLKRLPDCYEIEWKGVSLRDPAAIISALKGLDAKSESDLIGVIRGGGELEVFDDPEVALAAAGLSTPFVTAIGHTVDRRLCDQVADKDFGTPAALGVFLAEMAAASEKEFAAERRLAERGRGLAAREAELSRKESDFSRREGELLQRLAGERQADGDGREAARALPKARAGWRLKLLYLAAGAALGLAVGFLIARGMDWPRVAPESESSRQAQPTPETLPSPAASPASDGRRRRR